jgi:hypothetical protein
VKTLDRRLLRLETVAGRRVFRHLSDDELDARLAAELRAWLDAEPDGCPAELRPDALAVIAACAAAPKAPPTQDRPPR